MEVFSDGIPKIMELSLSFAEIKLKYENDFETPFTTNDKANSDEYNNIVENHDNAIKAQKQKEQKEAEEKQKQKEQAEKNKKRLEDLAKQAQEALEASIKNKSALFKGFGAVAGMFVGNGKPTNIPTTSIPTTNSQRIPNLHR